MEPPLLHVATLEDLERARRTGRYRAASLEAEGFLHCCDPEQLPGVLERFFADAVDIALLRVDPARLDARVVRENTVGGEELFPHVYGEIPMSAVIAVEPLGGARAGRAGPGGGSEGGGADGGGKTP